MWAWSSSLLLLVVVAAASWLWWRCGHFRRLGVAHVPPLPGFGSMLPFTLRRESLYDVVLKVYRSFPGQDCCGFFSYTKPVLVLRAPEMVRAVAVKDFDHFTDHSPLVTEDVDPIFGKNLFALTGERWKEMRTSLSPVFTSSKIKHMFVFMSEIGRQMTDYLQGEVNKSTGPVLTLEMKNFFTMVTNDVIATTAFGVKVDSLCNPDNEFCSMGKKIGTLSTLRNLAVIGYLMVPRLMKFLRVSFLHPDAKDFFLGLVSDMIKVREERRIVRPDLIHLLMQLRKGELEGDDSSGTKHKANLTDLDIAAQALIFFFAGFDTVSTVMCFASHSLAVNLDVQRKLREEVDGVMRETRGAPGYGDVQAMKYLDMVVNETLRLYPPAPFLDRICVKEYHLRDNLLVRPGDCLWIPVFALHRDPQLYPDPDRFDPQRFSPENRHNIGQMTYAPFGVGPRFCIAQRFALLEVKVILVHLLAKFELVKVPQTPRVARIVNKGLVSAIEGGAWLGILPRDDI